MMINDENKKKNGKFYARIVCAALGVCVLAAGVIGYSASMSLPDVNVKTTLPQVTSQNRTETPTYHSEKVTVDMNTPEETSPAKEIENTVPEETSPDVKAVFGNEEESLTGQDNSKPAKYQLPLSAEMGKDYSMGLPVFNSTMGDYRTHNGVDFVGKPGDSVKPVAAGRVTAVENDTVKGNCVTVDHGGGVVSTIWGLADEGLVTEGVEVIEESVIGTLGNIPCENKDGTHIHLEIRVNGELADPLEVMGLAENTKE